MANVSLIKDDGQPLILPGNCITAVVSFDDPELDGRKGPENPQDPDSPEVIKHPDALSLVFSTFRGHSIHYLAQPASEVFEMVKAADKTDRTWQELAALAEGQKHFFTQAIEAVEGEVKGGIEDGPWLKVWIMVPATGATVHMRCANTQENIEAAVAAMNGGETAKAPKRKRN